MSNQIFYISGNRKFYINENSGVLVLNNLDLRTNSRPTINGTGVLLSGEGATLPSTIVYTTGNQTINGNKTFSSPAAFISGLVSNQIIGLNITAPNLVYTTGNQTISGEKIFKTRPTVNGTGVLLSGEAANVTLPATIVYNTGNQNIDGSKTFNDSIVFSSDVRFLRNAGTADADIDLLSRPYSNTRVSIGTDTEILGESINTQYFSREIKIWETGGYNTPFSVGPFMRIGARGVLISEQEQSNVGIGTLFPQQKVHISGGNLRVDGDVSANNLVYTTGNQTIFGNKTFATGAIYLGTSIISAKSGVSENFGIGGVGGNIYLDGGNSYSTYDGGGLMPGGNGGYIDLRGGRVLGEYLTSPGGNGGFIELRGAGDGIDVTHGSGGYFQANGSIALGGTSNGGFIELNANVSANGGYIKLNAGPNGALGGYIEANGFWDGDFTYPGGFINLNSTINGPGGSLNLSEGGGSIDTRGQGQIQFGVDSTRTTLSGTASENRTIYLPNENGTLLTTSSNVVYTTGDQTISGEKIFKTRPTVNGTGVLLSGQGIFKSTFTHAETNMNNDTYYFANLYALNASVNKTQRVNHMMQKCKATFASWNTYTTVAREQDSTINKCTGYFINNTTTTTGTISTQIRHTLNGTLATFTGAINPPIDINFGDQVQLALKVPSYATGMSGVINSVDVTFFY